eukprot:g6487.t1
MSRAYRPRLSKDKAVAQRLQDLSTERQLAAVDALDIAGTPSPSPPPTPPPASAVGESDAIDDKVRPSDPAMELSSTPAPTPVPLKEDGSSSRSRRNSNRRKRTPTPAGKQKGSRACATAGTTAATTGSKSETSTAVSPASCLKNGGGSGRSSSSRKQRDVTGSKEGGGGNGGGGGGGGSRRCEWACVSCSFLNLATAKKCRICSTKNYQARLSPPTASAPSPSPSPSAATAASNAASRKSAVREPQRQRQSGSGVRERRSPRGVSQKTSTTADTTSTAVTNQKEHQKELEGNHPVEDEAGVEDDAGAGKNGSWGGCGDGTDTARQNRRDSAPRHASAASGAGAESVACSRSAEEAAAAVGAAAGASAAGGAPRRKRGRGTMKGDAAIVARAATASSSGGGGGAGGGRNTSDAGGAEHLNPRTQPPSLPASLSSRNCGKKRPRSPTRTPPPAPPARAAEGATEVNSAGHLSPITLTDPTGPTTRKDLSSLPFSGEADPPPPLTDGCDGPAAEANGHDSWPPAQSSPRKVQTTPPPCVVPPLTADCDELERGPLEGPALASTARRRGRPSTPKEVASTRGPRAASSPAPLESASSSPVGSGHGTATVARVASLDFTSRSSWKVSSVVVMPATGGSGKCHAGATTSSRTATIVVCHSGGVSVWDLTHAEAVCTHLSPALSGVAKEAARGSFSAAAVVGGDPSEVTPSATRAPGGSETYILAIGRHATDPGLPIIRVWQQQQRRQGQGQGQQGVSSPLLPLPPQAAERFGGRNSMYDTGGTAVQEKPSPAATTTPPAVLMITLKKKFMSFFATPVPKHVRPCLCVCGHEPAAAAAVGGLEKDSEANVGAMEDGGAGAAGKTTAVMSLGGRVLRLVFGADRSGEQQLSGRPLPTGVASEAVCTSLAPVPSNPFLVCASLPSANAVVLWNVRETERLFTLPLTALSICVLAATDAARDAMTMSPLYAGGGATTAPAAAPAAPAAGPCASSEFEAEPSPGLPPSVGSKRSRPDGTSAASAPATVAHAAARRPEPQLLCLLATGGMGDGRIEASRESRRTGCRLFGIVCVGDGDGAGAHTCGKVSAIPLDAGADEEGRAPPVRGATENPRNGGGNDGDIRRGNTTGSDGDNDDARLRYLSDGGNDFVVGVDGRGTIVATSTTTAESRVLLTPDAERATVAPGGDAGTTFAAMDYDHSSGIAALATAGGADRVGAAAASVDLYELRIV